MKKAGRNDPCPCGSGKKFKKCCEGKPLGARQITVNPAKNLSTLFQQSVQKPVEKRDENLEKKEEL